MQQTLFDIPTMETAGKTSPKNFCRECLHRQRWKCNSKVFQYCAKRKSKRTENGLLKIKCKISACGYFEKEI
jgi:hypothetical protein